MKKQPFKLRLLPVIAYMALVFLLVRASTYSVDVDNPNIPYDSSTQLWDVFSYVKASVIFIISIWALITMAYLLITGQMKIKKTKIYIPMLIYTAFVLASYFISDYKSVAWLGSGGRFEGTRTILCYVFMLFYTINVVDELRDAKIVLIVTLAAVFIACGIGITQLVGDDILLTNAASFLITGGGDLSLQGEFWPGQVYQTVMNMNYVGMYLSLIVPLLVYALIFFISKNNTQKLYSIGIDDKKRDLILGLIVLFLFMIALNVYGAESLGGFLGICVSLVALAVVLCKPKWQKATILLAALLGLTAALVLSYTRGADTNKQIDYIETGVDLVTFSVNGHRLDVIYHRENSDFEARNEEGNPIDVFYFAEEPGVYQLEDERFAGEVIVIPTQNEEGIPCVIVDMRDQQFGFIFYEDGAKYLNPFGNEVSLEKVKSTGFTGHLTAGSGRGYIWSRTIPLIKERLAIGSGADTFMLIFPHDDYAGKYSSLTPLNVICDKPHNMYLSMIIGTGGMSLLAFGAIIIVTILFVNRLPEEKKLVKVMAAGIIGFLIAGIFNDSSVCTMPMFYGMLGMVIGLV